LRGSFLVPIVWRRDGHGLALIGITTSVIGALKRGLAPLQGELGIYVCGGRGNNCAHLAEEATDEPTRRRYQRMYLSWLSLIESEARLEGKVAPSTSAGSDPLKLLLETQH
jgi:hypothetical protein